MSRKRKPETRLVEAGRRKEWTQGLVNPAVWRASTILFDSVAEMKAADPPRDGTLHYGRNGTPTTWALCEALTELEPGAAMTRLYPSGSAAVAGALLSVLAAGDELLMVDSAYGPTRALLRQCRSSASASPRIYYDPMIGARHRRPDRRARPARSSWKARARTRSRSRTCPASARPRRRGGLVTLIDNTWATPLFFPAIAAGVDLSILACTKYIGGHADLMLGSVTATRGLCRAARADPPRARPDRRARRCLAGAARPADARRPARAAPGERPQGRPLARRRSRRSPACSTRRLPDCPGHEHLGARLHGRDRPLLLRPRTAATTRRGRG